MKKREDLIKQIDKTKGDEYNKGIADMMKVELLFDIRSLLIELVYKDEKINWEKSE